MDEDEFVPIGNEVEICARANGELVIKAPFLRANPTGSRIMVVLSPRDHMVIRKLSDWDDGKFHTTCQWVAIDHNAVATMRKFQLAMALQIPLAGWMMQEALEEGMKGLASQIKWMLRRAVGILEIDLPDLYKR